MILTRKRANLPPSPSLLSAVKGNQNGTQREDFFYKKKGTPSLLPSISSALAGNKMESLFLLETSSHYLPFCLCTHPPIPLSLKGSVEISKKCSPLILEYLQGLRKGKALFLSSGKCGKQLTAFQPHTIITSLIATLNFR